MEKKTKAISEFVTDLSQIFPKEKPIVVYARLLDIHLKSKEHAHKHVNIFKRWIQENGENIKTKSKNFKVNRIQYTDSAYIDMDYVMKNVVQEDEIAIWQHLSAINYVLFPSEQTKTLLKSSFDTKSLIPSNTNEGKLIENALDKVTAGLGEGEADPNAVLSNLFTSGAIGDIMASVSSGNVDPKKLIGIAQNMLNKLSEKIEPTEELD